MFLSCSLADHYPTTDDHYRPLFWTFIEKQLKFIKFIFAPWQETFADAGDGDGDGDGDGRGTNRDQYLYHHPIYGKIFIDSFFDPIQKNMFINPTSISLKWPILTVSPLFEKPVSQPMTCTKNKKITKVTTTKSKFWQKLKSKCSVFQRRVKLKRATKIQFSKCWFFPST